MSRKQRVTRRRSSVMAPRGLHLPAPRKHDSVAIVKRRKGFFGHSREGRVQSFALLALLLMGGFAIAGPSGLLAWSENLRLLDQRETQLAKLTAERDMLRNKVELLDPESADPDMVGELLRSQLNVVHPDEVVIKLEEPAR